MIQRFLPQNISQNLCNFPSIWLPSRQRDSLGPPTVLAVLAISFRGNRPGCWLTDENHSVTPKLPKDRQVLVFPDYMDDILQVL